MEVVTSARKVTTAGGIGPVTGAIQKEHVVTIPTAARATTVIFGSVSANEESDAVHRITIVPGDAFA